MQQDSPENNLLQDDINYLEKLAFRRKILLTNCFTRIHTIRSDPRGQSVDFQRDLNWKAILEYIRLSGAERQGEKLRLTRTEARARNKKMYLLHEQGRADGKKGQELQRWVEEELDLFPMDEGNYGRYIRLGQKIVEAERKAANDESKK